MSYATGLYPVLLQDGGGFSNIVVLILPLFLIWYFLVIRPQSRERKLQTVMRSELKKGDKILTQSGVIAKVHSVQDNEVVLSLDGTAKMRVAKETVVRRLDESRGADKGGATEKANAVAG